MRTVGMGTGEGVAERDPRGPFPSCQGCSGACSNHRV